MGILLACNLSRYGWVVSGLQTVVLLGLLVIQGCTTSAPDVTNGRQPGPLGPGELPPASEVGRLAPDFTLSDLDGNWFRLSDLRGKVVFVNFWATWCPACCAEMPEMEAVYQEYKDKNVVVVGVDISEPEDEVRQFVGEGGYNWTFVIDTIGVVMERYDITAIPTSIFIDREGVIRVVNIGAMNKRGMEVKLAEAMK